MKQLIQLKTSLTESDVKHHNWPLSFAPWPDDYYHEATDWTDWTEDTYGDRCSKIISKIENALDMSRLLEKSEQLIYFNTLLHLLDGIINNSGDLNYLLNHLTQDKHYLLMTILINHGMTAQQIVTFSEHPDCRYDFLTALFVTENKSTANLKLIKTALAINYHSPEARVALALMGDSKLSHDFISRFKEYYFLSDEDRTIRDYFIQLMYSIRNNRHHVFQSTSHRKENQLWCNLLSI